MTFSLAGLLTLSIVWATTTTAEALTPDLAYRRVSERLLSEGWDKADVQRSLEGSTELETSIVQTSDIIALGTVTALSPTLMEGLMWQEVELVTERCLTGSCSETLLFLNMMSCGDCEPYELGQRAVVLLRQDPDTPERLYGSAPVSRYEIAEGAVLRKGIHLELFLDELEAIVRRRSPEGLLSRADHVLVGIVEKLEDKRVLEVRRPRPEPERYMLFHVTRALKGNVLARIVRVDLPPHGTIHYSDVPAFAVGDSCAIFTRSTGEGRLKLVGGRAAAWDIGKAEALVTAAETSAGRSGPSPN